MELRQPVWHILVTCPDCSQGYPELMACPRCSVVVAVCLETNLVFADPHSLGSSALDDANDTLCPACKATAVSEFAPATSDQIRKAGIHVGEYA